MAKVNLEYDTVDKTCTITVDGKALSNVKDCSVYYDYYESDRKGVPTFAFYATTSETDKDNKLEKVEMIRASVVQPQEVHKSVAAFLFPAKEKGDK
jgi:hypothetical protein